MSISFTILTQIASTVSSFCRIYQLIITVHQKIINKSNQNAYFEYCHVAKKAEPPGKTMKNNDR